MIEHLPVVHPGPEERTGIAGADHPMRQVTRQVAFDQTGWDGERADKVRDLFDSMASEWHTRLSDDRYTPLVDALDRGAATTGMVAELGSGLGDSTSTLERSLGPVVSIDLSMEMLRRAPTDTRRVRADASRLPLPDTSVDTIVLVNALLFPEECDRVLRPSGTIVWVNTSGDRTPIHLSAEDVVAALPGEWAGAASEAGNGSWCVVRRDLS